MNKWDMLIQNKQINFLLVAFPYSSTDLEIEEFSILTHSFLLEPSCCKNKIN